MVRQPPSLPAHLTVGDRNRTCYRSTDRDNILLRLYLGVWENPHPEKKVTELGYSSAAARSAPFCVAITVEESESLR